MKTAIELKTDLTNGIRHLRVASEAYARSLRKWKWLILATLAALILALVHPWSSRASATDAAGTMLGTNLLPAVAVARVDREDLATEDPMTAEFRPYQEVELHAKVSGYLQQISVDIGDHVKSGQLLATLEVPELRNELDSALASEQRAEADYTNSHLAYKRLVKVSSENPGRKLVAQQDLDTASAKDLSAAAAIAAAKADVEKYLTLASYTNITAPFDGVITHRYADPGALIQAGTASDTQSLPLVRVSDNYRLRLDFPVDVDIVKNIQTGQTVDVRVGSLDGRTFTGKISRTTLKVDDATRKMLTEMEVPNPKLDIVPGMYATVVLKTEQRSNVLAVPVEAVFGGTKRQVLVVGADCTIEERPVELGLETPAKYEVRSGLKEGEMVVIGNRGSLKPGEKVEARFLTVAAAQP